MPEGMSQSAPAAAAPPPSMPAAPAAPAVAPQPASTAPVVAPPSAPVGAVTPAPVEATAAPVTPGASASEPARPTTIEEARAKFDAKVADVLAKEAAQPKELEPPSESQEPKADLEAAAPVEEPPAPVETKVEAEPAPEASDDLETILTAELIDAKYPRMQKEAKAAMVKLEADRGRLRDSVQAIGGEPGLKLAEALNPIIWNENPTTEDVDKFFDYLVLPEHAQAGKLFDLMGKHLVNVQLQDPETGKEFASNMISTEWGKQPDNATDYSLEFVDNVIKLHKSWGTNGEGKPIDLATVDMLVRGLQKGHINRELVEAELAGEESAKPDPEKEALRQELEALKAGKATEKTEKDKATEAEQTRERERTANVYRTQARAWVSNQLVNEVMPLAKKENWVNGEGEESTPKTTLGKMVTAYINSELMGAADAPTPQYAEIKQMIEERTAFDVNGRPTERFMVKITPFKNRARALFSGLQQDLNPALKFTAAKSRNAQLAKQNGHTTGAPAEPPPLAAATPQAPESPMSQQQQIAELQRKYEEKVRGIMASANLGQLQ